jgi:hypothetical protein
MSQFQTDDILTLKPSTEDIYLGARYAGISLPWTYDRMEQENKNSTGTRDRAFNISKGVVGQRLLASTLQERGVDVQLEEKSHRETDAYDIRFPSDIEVTDLDLKTFNHFTNYGVDEKPKLTAELISSNAQYEGSEWGHFFPMLVPFDQFTQQKDAYCFGLSSSIDFRNTIEGRKGYELYAFPKPDSTVGEFMMSNVKKRESTGQSFSLNVVLSNGNDHMEIDIKIIGEFDGGINEEWITIQDKSPVTIERFSGINSFKIKKSGFDKLQQSNRKISISVEERSLSDQPIQLDHDDFSNLLMPSNFSFYFIGWIPKAEFKTKAMKHPGWIGPSEDTFYKNQRWDYLKPEEKHLLKNNGVSWAVDPNGGVQGALRKGTGCYYYPKLTKDKPWIGGLRKTNLYVLPENLRSMDTF